MPTFYFKTPDGEQISIEAEDGTLMEAAVENGVPGIDADCGGMCSCGTCHVRVDPAWVEKVGPPNSTEQGLLNLFDDTDGASRLSCQIEVSDELDGLIVTVAPQA